MIKLRTKIIVNTDEKFLEKELNEFLETIDHTMDVLDIQYRFSDRWFSALILYYIEEKDNLMKNVND